MSKEQESRPRRHRVYVGPGAGLAGLTLARNVAKGLWDERVAGATTPEQVQAWERLRLQLDSIRRQCGLDELEPLDHVLRAPHHSVSAAGLTGVLAEGWRVRPGEVSLAHSGVLYLDELGSFRRDALVDTANALAAGAVELRGEGGTRVVVPAGATLVGALAACDCGRWGQEDLVSAVKRSGFAGTRSVLMSLRYTGAPRPCTCTADHRRRLASANAGAIETLKVCGLDIELVETETMARELIEYARATKLFMADHETAS